jgi:transposase
MARLKAHHEQTLTPAGDETVKLIRQTRQATQKRYTAEEKIRIVMEGIRGEDPVSAICRREGIHSNLYYRWLKDFMEAGKARLKGEETRGATGSEVDELQREKGRLKELVADLSVQVMVLKKSLL